jgi:hypothetical protein
MERDAICQTAAERLYRWLHATETDVQRILDDPQFVVENGWRDPCQPFLKNEPHPMRKVREKRWRIICAVSLVDQLVERAIFSPWCEVLRDHYPLLDCAIGIGFSDSQLQEFGETIERETAERGYTPVSSDVAGWDKSVSYDMLRLESELVSNKIRDPQDFVHVRTAITVWMVTSSCVAYAMPDGRLLVKVDPGLMPSGSYRTTTANSVMRLLVAAMADSASARAAGDDCLEWTQDVAGLSDRYAAMGLTVRDVVEHTETSFGFCSHTYTKSNGTWVASLDTWPKAIFKLVSRLASEERQAAVLHELRYNAQSDVARIMAALATIPSACDLGNQEESQ